MNLKNKKTGEIVEAITGDTFERGGIQIRSLKRNPQIVRHYPSLAELNEEWEDAPEEPKGVKSIYFTGATVYIEMSNQKEAIEVEEKLKAWKRLKDKGFRFYSYYDSAVDVGQIYANFPEEKPNGEIHKDLDLLFSGEDD